MVNCECRSLKVDDQGSSLIGQRAIIKEGECKQCALDFFGEEAYLK